MYKSHVNEPKLVFRAVLELTKFKLSKIELLREAIEPYLY